MNNYLKISLIALLAATAGFGGGFLLGVDQGVKQFFLLESSVKASLLTFELQALRAGNAKKIIDLKEIELDGEVVRFAQFRREGYPWIFWLQEGYERDHKKYMERVAAYRKQHPPYIPTLRIGEESPMKMEADEFAKEVTRTTGEIIKEYEK